MSLPDPHRTAPVYGHLVPSNSSSAGSSTTDLPKEASCIGKCCRCLASVPCSALTCWLMTTISVATCGGALMVASRRTSQLLDINIDFIPADAICLGVIFGMVGLVTIFLIAATLTSRPMNASFVGSSRKTSCVQAWLVLKIMLLLLLLVAWLAVCFVLAYPLSVFTMVYTQYYRGEACVDLQPFLLTQSKWEICGQDFKNFYRESEAAFECYLISTVGAILSVISLVFYLMYTSANYIQIKEMAPTEYSVYRNDIHGNKTQPGSVLDTRM